MSHANTRIVQERVSEPSEAQRRFTQATEAELPVVLVPDDRWICSCWMTVPQGVHCIEHRFGKDMNPDSLADPGLHCPSGACNRIAYCVTAQACTYNAPVKTCPTKDNVMVDADLTLMFTIGPSPKDVKQFVYTLGALRMNEFVAAAVEEGVRQLIRLCKHTEIYELRGGNDMRVVQMMRELNKKFERFGVHFTSAVITDIRFSEELQNILQDTTNFKSKISAQAKKQKHEMDKIQYDADKMMEKQLKEQQRQLQELQAQRTRAEIDRGVQVTNMHSKTEADRTAVEQKIATLETRAIASLSVAETEAMRQAEAILAKAKAEDERTRIAFIQECKTAIMASEQKVLAAEDYANALIAEAEAEEKAIESLVLKREHELEMTKLKVLEKLAANSRIIVSGKTGDAVLESMLNPKVLGDGSLFKSK